jgi:hypothetical protein
VKSSLVLFMSGIAGSNKSRIEYMLYIIVSNATVADSHHL